MRGEGLISFVCLYTPLEKRINSPSCCDTSNPASHKNRKRYRARVAYDGTAYSGWQFQDKMPTIQGEIEKAISRKTGTLTRVVGASRTDSGVHARGQGIHFDMPSTRAPLQLDDIQKMQFTLNQMLPGDVRLTNLSLAPKMNGNDDNDQKTWWHSIYNSTGKLYVYRFSTASILDPMERLYRHHDWRAARFGFSESLLYSATEKFVGAHDFSAFTNTTQPPPGIPPPVLTNPIRTIRSAEVIYEGQGCYKIEFRIDGAMYKMIRNIVGTILDVMCEKRELDSIDYFFESRDRRLVPKSAPAHGLCLEEVFYDGWPLQCVEKKQEALV